MISPVFENPYNLAKITPPWRNSPVLIPNFKMRLGAEIDYEFRWMGIPLRWRTRITGYEPPFHFVDEALKSPYLLWRHRHTFRASQEGQSFPAGWKTRFRSESSATPLTVLSCANSDKHR